MCNILLKIEIIVIQGGVFIIRKDSISFLTNGFMFGEMEF